MVLQLLFLFFSTVMTNYNYSASTAPAPLKTPYGITPKEMRTLYELLARYDEDNIPEAQAKLPKIKTILQSISISEQTDTTPHKELFRHLFDSLLENDTTPYKKLFSQLFDRSKWFQTGFSLILFQDLNESDTTSWINEHCHLTSNTLYLSQGSYNVPKAAFDKKYILLTKLFIEMGYGYYIDSSDVHDQYTLSAQQQRLLQSTTYIFDALDYTRMRFKKRIPLNQSERSLFVTYLDFKYNRRGYQPLRELLLLEPWAIASATGENFAIQEMAHAMERIFKPDCIKPILQFLVHTAPEGDKLLLQKVQIEYERYLNLDRPPLWKSRMQEVDDVIRPGTIKRPYQKALDLKAKYQDIVNEKLS